MMLHPFLVCLCDLCDLCGEKPESDSTQDNEANETCFLISDFDVGRLLAIYRSWTL